MLCGIFVIFDKLIRIIGREQTNRMQEYINIKLMIKLFIQ